MDKYTVFVLTDEIQGSYDTLCGTMSELVEQLKSYCPIEHLIELALTKINGQEFVDQRKLTEFHIELLEKWTLNSTY